MSKTAEISVLEVRHNMKAQSAVEYLTTYGWMIVTVGIVSSVVYSAIGTGCVESSSGFVSQSIGVSDFGYTTENDLAILMENRRSDNIVIEEVIVEGTSIIVNDGDLGPGSSSSIALAGFKQSEGCNNFDLKIVYSIGDLSNQKTSGTITGPYSNDGNPPEAADNLLVQYSG